MTSLIYNIGGIITYDLKSEDVITSNVDSILIKNNYIDKINCNSNINSNTKIDAKGCFLTPGFIDSHTHLIFSSNRANDFNRRIAGDSYQKIAESGGGIKSSINSLRNSTKEELLINCSKHVNRILKSGTTTIEAKSGYGLSLPEEIKSLETIKELNQISNIDIIPTFMGAHDFPIGTNNDSYVDLVCDEMIPEISKYNLAEFCDIFCEDGYFNHNQTTKIAEKAKEYNLDIKLHVDEFNDSNGAFLAGELNAVSADHLMKSNSNGLSNMAKNNVIATILPGTTLFLGLNSFADAKKMIKLGCDVAVASDFNPGSCHIKSMPFIIGLSCIYLGLSIEEALKAATWSGACAINEEERIGSIEVGKKADLIIWDLDTIEQIPYNITSTPIRNVIKDGDPLISLD